MNTPFARLALSYAERGFSPLPIGPNSKVPGFRTGHLHKWEQFCDVAADARQIASWGRCEPEAGIGLACGFNDLVAVDVDNVKACGAVREVFGGIHPPTKRGRKGATAFFCSKGVSIRARKFREKPFENSAGKIVRPTLVEILAHGNQTVIPPSIHPETGKPYAWIHGSPEEVLSPRDLPVITPRHVEQLAEALAPIMPAWRDDEPSAQIKVRAADIDAAQRKRFEGFAYTALKAETSKLAQTNKPGRNAELFRISCLLGKWVANGILPQDFLERSLLDACQANGLIRENGPKDVKDTLADGLFHSRNDALPDLTDRQRRAA
jgi:hypothetical protein